MDRTAIACPAAAVAVAAAMVGAAGLLGEPEVIFPEVMALAAGALAAPRLAWRTSPARMVALIAACSTAGVLVVRAVPAPAWVQAVIAYALCQVALPFTGTTFAPMVSAAVLPVILGTTSWVYPAAAVALTTLVAGARRALERLGLRDAEPFSPLPSPVPAKAPAVALRTVLGGAWLAGCVAAGMPFCAAPPLLVAFTELSRPGCPARSKPWKTVLLVGLCAAAGAASRLALCVALGLPLVAAAAAAAAASLALMRAFGRYLPPAGAMAILPMIVPAQALPLFPVQALVGIAVLALCSAACFPAPAAEADPAAEEAL